MLKKTRSIVTSQATVDHRCILNEFPQHWLGELDVHVTDQWAKSGDGFIYKIPRHDRPINILSKDDEGLHRLAVNAAQFDEVKKSGRKVRVVFTSKALGFAGGEKQPETLQELIRWAGNQEFDLDQKIINGLADQRPEDLAIFIAASNGIVGALGKTPFTSVQQRRLGLVQVRPSPS